MRAFLPVAAVMTAISVQPLPAIASPQCVQEQLAGLGYNAGPADGVLGSRSTEAAAQFLTDIGLDLPELGKTTTDQWCAALQDFAASPAAAILTTPAAQLLPKDLLVAFAGAAPERRAGMCRLTSYSLSGLARIEPVKKIEGFTSRMKGDQDRVPGARDAETFAARFAAQAAHAFAADDPERKGRLLDILHNWATQRAFLDTISCVRPNGDLITTGACTEWTVPDGSDLSGMKDATFATFLAVGIVRAYTIALADFERTERAAQHKDIAAWIAAIGKRLKQPTSVYFGLNMGWYWPSIGNDLTAGRTDKARAKLQRLLTGLTPLVLADGSIKDRTTRGDRALWYHYTSIGEIVISLEMMRASGIAIPPRLEERLHKAVALFVGAVKDPAVLDPWASKRHNARYDGTQDWNFTGWPNEEFGGSWLHIYPFRYPDREEAVALRDLVRTSARSATSDTDFGFGLGCIYNAAALGRS